MNENTTNLLTEETEEELIACADCGALHPASEMEETADGLVCKECIEEDYVRCEGCGQLVFVGNTIFTADECTYCDYCKWDEAFCCSDCGNWYSNNFCSYETEDDDLICADCAESGAYSRCDHCGRMIYDVRVCIDEDGYAYCEDCMDMGYGNFRDEDDYGDWRINDYHYAPCTAFYGDINARGFIGFELEADKGSNFTSAIDGIEDAVGDRVYFEHDGSLDSGFETISHPHTYEQYASGAFNISGMLKAISNAGFKSHDAGTCGLHFHLSRTYFGDESVQESNIAKMIFFYDHFYNDIVNISRRTTGQLHWCQKHFVNTKDDALAKTKGDGGRYHAVNTTNQDTIEIRIMRGTLNYETFMASLDFVYRVAINSNNIDWDDVSDVNLWLDGINKNTIDYIRKRGALATADVISGNTDTEVAICA